MLMPNANVTSYHKGICCIEIKLFNNISPRIKNLNHDMKLFKPAIERLSRSFYSVEEFFSIGTS
jgi:hypothetical protein